MSEATAQERLDFLIGEVMKAVRRFDQMPLEEYFDRVQGHHDRDDLGNDPRDQRSRHR